MEVLNGMYGLERLPVLEPDDLFVRQPTAIKDSAGHMDRPGQTALESGTSSAHNPRSLASLLG